MEFETPSKQKKKKKYQHPELDFLLDDLSIRFIINIPEEEFEFMERVCFQVELAHWFYEDFFRGKDPTLPKLSMEEFTQLMFEHCPLLMPYRNEVDDILAKFKSYKTQVPVFGAIMLNPTLDKCLLVKGWTSKSSWGFPKGKINKDEPEVDCAIREVLEETGFDLEGRVREDDYVETAIREQKVKLFIVPGIREDSKFEPRTRKEIGMIAWFPVEDLPTTAAAAKGMPSEYDSTGNNFFMVIPFVHKLIKWIDKWGKKRMKELHRREWVKEVMGTATPSKAMLQAVLPSTPSAPATESTQRSSARRNKQTQQALLANQQFYANPSWMSGTNPTAINLMRQLDAAAISNAPADPLRAFSFRMPDIMSAMNLPAPKRGE